MKAQDVAGGEAIGPNDPWVSQRCPHCGTVEAPGGYCTRCLAESDPSWLFKQEIGYRLQKRKQREPDEAPDD